MVRFHSFRSDQAELGTSQPRDAWVGQLVLEPQVVALVQPGGLVHLVNLWRSVLAHYLGWSRGTKVQGHHALCLEAHRRCWGDLVNLLYTRLDKQQIVIIPGLASFHLNGGYFALESKKIVHCSCLGSRWRCSVREGSCAWHCNWCLSSQMYIFEVKANLLPHPPPAWKS